MRWATLCTVTSSTLRTELNVLHKVRAAVKCGCSEAVSCEFPSAEKHMTFNVFSARGVSEPPCESWWASSTSHFFLLSSSLTRSLPSSIMRKNIFTHWIDDNHAGDEWDYPGNKAQYFINISDNRVRHEHGQRGSSTKSFIRRMVTATTSFNYDAIPVICQERLFINPEYGFTMVD